MLTTNLHALMNGGLPSMMVIFLWIVTIFLGLVLIFLGMTVCLIFGYCFLNVGVWMCERLDDLVYWIKTWLDRRNQTQVQRDWEKNKKQKAKMEKKLQAEIRARNAEIRASNEKIQDRN